MIRDREGSGVGSGHCAEQRGESMEPHPILLGQGGSHCPPAACAIGCPATSNQCPEEKHSTTSFLPFRNIPCGLKAAPVSFPSPQSPSRASHSSPCGLTITLRPALLKYWQHHPFSLPAGAWAHPAINLQMGYFLLQREIFFFLRSAVFKYSQMTSPNQSEIYESGSC